MKPENFNIRVYGIYLNDFGEVLITDEVRNGFRMVKFPGGGLEFGEGPVDCLKRECIEESGQEFEVIEHLYTVDFFQRSVFNPSDQIISIYYLIKPVGEITFEIKKTKFDFNERDNYLTFRICPLKGFDPLELTFPIDRIVIKKLQNKIIGLGI